eukprot:TRINITY_DN110734_c0_g1_i1.p3 TRINITY_DN110734_c0_g1~~TRINITY_DN110734_c0_g1_i1.p3  ORF type:complete len:119 (-),score=32.37 TRINITY_DN110734_c0_g1_i1:578-934(-)
MPSNPAAVTAPAPVAAKSADASAAETKSFRPTPAPAAAPDVLSARKEGFKPAPTRVTATVFGCDQDGEAALPIVRPRQPGAEATQDAPMTMKLLHELDGDETAKGETKTEKLLHECRG